MKYKKICLLLLIVGVMSLAMLVGIDKPAMSSTGNATTSTVITISPDANGEAGQVWQSDGQGGACWATVSLNGTPGVATWGGITGNLYEQVDLQSALDSKETPVGAQTKVNVHVNDFAHSDISLNTADRHNHQNIVILNGTEESFTTELKTSYDWLVNNVAGMWKTTVDMFMASKGEANGIAPLDEDAKVPLINLPASGSSGGITISGATVFLGTSPETWADLDLSNTIGANSALVILSISATADMDAIAVRMNGDNAEYFNVANDANAYGVALAHHDSTSDVVLICVTDSNGIMEWQAEQARTATITLIAYIK